MKKLLLLLVILVDVAHATMVDQNMYIPAGINNRNTYDRNTREGYLQYGGSAGRIFTPEASDAAVEHMIFDDSGSYSTNFGKALNANIEFVVPTVETVGEPLIGQPETLPRDQLKQLQTLDPQTRGRYNQGY